MAQKQKIMKKNKNHTKFDHYIFSRFGDLTYTVIIVDGSSSNNYTYKFCEGNCNMLCLHTCDFVIAFEIPNDNLYSPKINNR